MPNICVLTGHLGQDPEIFYTNDGDPVASFSLAFRSRKDDNTSWIKVSAFKRLAEVCEKYLHKGAKITVVGVIEQQKWKTNDGEARTGYKLLANNIEFIKTDGRGFDGNGQDEEDLPF